MNNSDQSQLSLDVLAKLVNELAITLNLERAGGPSALPHPLSWAAMCYLNFGTFPDRSTNHG